MDFIYELLRAGTNTTNSDSGAEVARKFNENFQKVADKFAEIDESLNNTMQTLVIGGLSQPVKDGKVVVPIGGLQQLGVVKSSDKENKIAIDEDGTMEVVSLNVNKLVQDDGDYIIFDGNI